jgi:hypothetical protein
MHGQRNIKTAMFVTFRNIPKKMVVTFSWIVYIKINIKISRCINPLNAELKPICHLLALLGAHHILHISGLRVNCLHHTNSADCQGVRGISLTLVSICILWRINLNLNVQETYPISVEPSLLPTSETDPKITLHFSKQCAYSVLNDFEFKQGFCA